MSAIQLTASVRRNLISLQKMSSELSAATARVASNVRVASAIDDAENYYAAQTLSTESTKMTERLDGMSETSEVINSADNGITSVKGYITQMKGLIDDALATTSSSDRRELGKQFNVLITQIRNIAQDSDYNGINLLYNNDSTTVQFSASYNASKLSVEGVNISAAEGGSDASGEMGSSGVVYSQIATDASGNTFCATSTYALTFDNNGNNMVGIQSAGTSGDSWEIDWGSTNYQTTLSSLESSLETMTSSLNAHSKVLAADLSIITMREDFTNSHTTILDTGSDDLTLADLNEDSARILTIKTYQSMAVQCLSMSSYAAQQALSTLQG
jgi:flagellin